MGDKKTVVTTIEEEEIVTTKTTSALVVGVGMTHTTTTTSVGADGRTITQGTTLIEGTSIAPDAHRMSSRELNNVGYSSSEQQAEGEPRWVLQQRKAFMRWCNLSLAQRGLEIKKFETDLQDGVMLINLIECLGGRKLPNYQKAPKLKVQKCLNLKIGLDWITKMEGLRLVGIGPEDLYDGNSKLILGLIWTLMLHYQLRTGKSQLLSWVNEALKSSIGDFRTSWSDGKAFLALLNHLLPQYKKSPLTNVPTDAVPLLDLVFIEARDQLGIPKLLDAEDMEQPDEQSVMTYVSYFRDKDNPKLAPEPEQPKEKPKAVVPTNTHVTGKGISEASLNEPAKFVLSTRDEQNETLYVADTKVTATVEHTAGASAPVNVTFDDQKDGVYLASYQVAASGPHHLNISVNGTPIRNEPYKVTVAGLKPSAKACVAKGEGLRVGKAGVPALFKVITNDEAGNPVNQGGAPLTGVLTLNADTSTTGRTETVEAKFLDNEDGTYDASYVPFRVGAYQLEIKLSGDPIQDSPFSITVTSDQVSASESTAEGEGLSRAVCGEKANFKITTRDSFGNVFEEKDNEIVVLVEPKHLESESEAKPSSSTEGSTPAVVNITNNHDGTYHVDYVASRAGTYSIKVLNRKTQPIRDSPFEALISPGAPDATRSIAEGDALKQALVGAANAFLVKTLDSHGNVIPPPTNPASKPLVSAALKSADGKVYPAEVANSADGEAYDVTYTPPGVGVYDLDVLVDDKHVQGSPFKVTVLPGDGSAAHTRAEGEGLSHATAGEPAEFKVLVFDVNDNPVRDEKTHQSVGAKVHSNADSSVVVPVTLDVSSGADGVNGTYTPKKAGEYTLDIKLGSEAIQKSPFTVTVGAGPASAPNSTVGDDKVPKSTRAGQPVKATLRTRDAFDNPLSNGGTPVAASLKGPNGSEEPAQVKDNNDGTYSVDATPKQVGPHELHVTLGDDKTPIQGSPFAFDVSAGDVDPSQTTAEGEGLTSAQAGKPAKFKVTTRDAFGNPTNPPADAPVKAVLIKSDDPSVTTPVNIQPSSDQPGVHLAEYTPQKSGPHALQVAVGPADGQPIKDAPFKVDVKPPEVSAQGLIPTGDGLSKATAGVPAAFAIQIRDADGKPIAATPEIAKQVSATIGSGEQQQPVALQLRPDDPSELAGEYTVQKSGPHQLTIGFKDDPSSSDAASQPVGKSPYTVSVASGPVSGPHSSLRGGDQPLKATVGEPLSLDLDLRDQFGNPVDADQVNPGDWKVSVAPKNAGEEGSQPATKELSAPKKDEVSADKPITFSPALDKPGNFVVDVDLGPAGKLKGSPLELNVQPASASSVEFAPAPADVISAGSPNTLGVQTRDAFGNPTPLAADQQLELVITAPDASTSTVPLKAGSADDGEEESDSASPEAQTTTTTTAAAPQGGSKNSRRRRKKQQQKQQQQQQLKQSKSAPSSDVGSYVPADDLVHTAVGKYKATVTLKDTKTGKDIASKSADFEVKHGDVDAGSSEATGKGLHEAVAGEEAAFQVSSKDKYGNKVTVGGGIITASLTPVELEAKEDEDADAIEAPSASTTTSSATPSPTGEQAISVNVKDNNDGTYDVIYVAQNSGKYDLAVQLNGQPVRQSPFQVNVGAAKTFAAKCKVAKPKKGSSPTDEAFTIHARDKYGNKKKQGGDEIEAILGKPIQRKAKVVDNGDGTYAIKYPPGLEKGEYAVTLTIGGEPVPASALPALVEVAEPEPLTEEQNKQLTDRLPQSSSKLAPLLLQLSAEERAQLFAELQNLKS